MLSVAVAVLAAASACYAVSDTDRTEDLPVPVKPKQKPVSVYGDKHLKLIEAQIIELAKQNNSDWSEKKEDARIQ